MCVAVCAGKGGETFVCAGLFVWLAGREEEGRRPSAETPATVMFFFCSTYYSTYFSPSLSYDIFSVSILYSSLLPSLFHHILSIYVCLSLLPDYLYLPLYYPILHCIALCALPSFMPYMHVVWDRTGAHGDKTCSMKAPSFPPSLPSLSLCQTPTPTCLPPPSLPLPACLICEKWTVDRDRDHWEEKHVCVLIYLSLCEKTGICRHAMAFGWAFISFHALCSLSPSCLSMCSFCALLSLSHIMSSILPLLSVSSCSLSL